eukprot:gene34233-biopygen21861
MYGKPFRAIHSTGTFKHNCYVTGCVALGGVCEEHGKTLVVGQKSVDLMEYLVERYTNAPGQLAMDPFMGSGSTGIAALRKGRCFYTRKPKIVLPIMVDNNGAKLRLIFNGKYLNSFLDFPRFKYEPLQPFVDLLRPEDGLFYWDYKSGYYHVDLHEGSRQYVAVEWLDVFYDFCVLPFDDFICAVRAPSLTDLVALAELASVIRDVELAGWLVSETKSHLFLTRELVHIGVGIDLPGRRLLVPDKAVAKIRSCAEQILSCFRRVPLRLVATFAGLVNAQWFVLGGAFCKLFTRSAAVLIADTLRAVGHLGLPCPGL